MQCLPVAAWLLLTALPFAPAHAFPNEPDGFGAARFGMGVAQVRSHFPKLETLLAPGASSSEFPVTIETYQVAGQSVLGLSGCRVRFYFANDELYRVGFDCDEDGELFPRLKERYGSPTRELLGNLHWLSDRRSVSLNPIIRRVTYGDRQRDALVQRVIQRFAMPSADQPPETTQQAAAPTAKTDFDWYDHGKLLETLHSRLDPEKEPSELVTLLNDITVFEDASSVPHVAPYLKHEDADVFDAAALALEHTDDDEATRVLGAVFEDPEADKARRLRAIQALTALRSEDSAAASLGKALADSDPEVRREAAMTMVLTADDGAPELLREALAREGDAETRAILERALEILAAPPGAASSGAQQAKVARQVGTRPKAQP